MNLSNGNARSAWAPDVNVQAAVLLAFEEGKSWAAAVNYIREMVPGICGVRDANWAVEACMMYFLRPEVEVKDDIRQAIRVSAIARGLVKE